MTKEEALKKAMEKFAEMSGTRLGDWIRYGKALQIEFKPARRKK